MVKRTLLVAFAIATECEASNISEGDICESQHDLHCSGQDIKRIDGVTDHETCCNECKSTAGCKAWSWGWNYPEKWCTIKSGCDTKEQDPNVHSGVSDSPSPPPPPTPPTPPGPQGGTCATTVKLGTDASIWDGVTTGRHPSCNLDRKASGMSTCRNSNGAPDATSLHFDASAIGSDRTGCFMWSANCVTDMTKVSTIEFDFEFRDCGDVWACPLWMTPDHWKEPGKTSGEIDFIEMCPVGSAATNFGAGGEAGEDQEKWGNGQTSEGTWHFTMTVSSSGSLSTTICNTDGSSCKAKTSHYDNFLNVVTSKYHHTFLSDVWNGYGGDGGWSGCHARNSPHTNCQYTITNIRVATKDGQPMYTDSKCSVLNKKTAWNSTEVVV